MLIDWYFFKLFSNKKELDGWISMSQMLVLIYQGLYKNHSFIIRRSWDWIHIDETSIEFGSQSSSWINIKTKTKQKNTHKQIKQKQKKNVKNKNKTKIIIYTVTFRGIVNEKKYAVVFFSTDATHTYNIILNTDTISILIPHSQWKAKNHERKISPKKGKQFCLLFSWTDSPIQLRYRWTQD